MSWWPPGWGWRRRLGQGREPAPPEPDAVDVLAGYYPPPPVLWASPPPWELQELPREVEAEFLRARRQWLLALKKLIEEELRVVEGRLQELESRE